MSPREAQLSPNFSVNELFDRTLSEHVPYPYSGQPEQAYLEVLLAQFNDPSQKTILWGMWALAGLTDPDDETTVMHVIDKAQDVTPLETALGRMLVAFNSLQTKYVLGASALLSQRIKGEIDDADLPDSLRSVDISQLPDSLPRLPDPDYPEFSRFIHDHLGLRIYNAKSRLLELLDMFTRGTFQYSPYRLRIIYGEFTLALPDAKIPEVVGARIYEARQGAHQLGPEQ